MFHLSPNAYHALIRGRPRREPEISFMAFGRFAIPERLVDFPT
jgi:hypothetical protein